VSKSSEEIPRLLKPSEVARILGVHRITMYQWIREGRIRVVRIKSGKRVWLRIPEEEVRRIIGGQ
jgi:excisionase family DNA binding protein